MSAAELLQRAVDFDNNGRYTEALRLYESGIGVLLQQCKVEPDPERKRRFETKIREALARAEELKKLQPTIGGVVHDKIPIHEGVTGYGYETIFGKYLDNQVHEVRVEEPYLREHYQLMNLLRFCELVVLRCCNLKRVIVITTKDNRHNSDQENALAGIKKSMMDVKRIHLEYRYSENLHDRQVILDNGFVIKPGRGLNYFKPTENKYSLGYFNYELRQCKECNVDVLYCEENKRRQ